MPNEQKVTTGALWRQFLPLSLSDVTMAFGDPAITTTLAHLPNARANLAAVGVAKSLAVFFESPIIMLLHASNSLSASRKSRAVLWRFTLLAMAILSLLLLLLATPPIFALVSRYILGIGGELATRSGSVLFILALWPAAIAWRRYYQGLLIRYGHGKDVGRAGVGRLFFVVLALGAGYLATVSGWVLASVTLIGGVIVEAVLVTLSAKRHHVAEQPDLESGRVLPTDIKGVWRFYWPLANSMLVVWGGRALLIGIVARSNDGSISLAVWPAAWGLVLLISNATRMVQQIVIRNRGEVSDSVLVRFTLSVGLVCSALLLFMGATPIGASAIASFVGGDQALATGAIPVILVCSLLPMIIAFQNAAQGFLIGDANTFRINAATWLGTGTLLVSASVAVAIGVSGATAAAFAMLLSLMVETVWLLRGVENLRPRVLIETVLSRRVGKIGAA